MKLINSLYAIIISSAILPFTALAQLYRFDSFRSGTPGGFGGGYGGSGNWSTRSYTITNFESLLGIAQTLLGYFQVIIFILAILFALVGAWKIIAGADFEAGRKNLLYAFVGVVIAMLAFAIIPLACWLTQASGPACSLSPGAII